LAPTDLEIKRRNLRFGCPRIAQQIAFTLALAIKKDVMRRILAQYYRPESGKHGPSWLTIMGNLKENFGAPSCFDVSQIFLRSY
jgi:hypothetical protein